MMNALQTLAAARSSNDWNAFRDTEWIRVSEHFWMSLSDINGVSEIDLEAFTTMLKDDALFRSARLVIPELRQAGAVKLDNSAKQYVLESTQDSRKLFGDTLGQQVQHLQDRFEKQESSIFHDSMVHRARLLVHDSGPFGLMDPMQIQEWLAACPKPATTAVEATT